jgi:hypothetical protein
LNVFGFERIRKRLGNNSRRLSVSIRFAGTDKWDRAVLIDVDSAGIYLERVEADGAYPWSALTDVGLLNAGTAQVRPR